MSGRRGTRLLLLAAITVIVLAVGGAYRFQKTLLQKQAPKKPAALPQRLNAAARDWEFTNSKEGKLVVSVRAKDFRQVKETGLVELDSVELKLHRKQAGRYDLVRSAKAEFRAADKILYSEGEVEITLAVPEESDDSAGNRLVSIRSSGVSFDTGTGRATTERAASFRFENGEGKCVGAFYDPATREAAMHAQVEVDWRSANGGKALKIESGQLIYKETANVILLFPWSRLSQEGARIDAGDTFITLEQGTIRKSESNQAKGFAEYPKQRLEYTAGHLWVDFGKSGAIEHVVGEPKAELVSITPAARTRITTNRIDLNFDTSVKGNPMKNALARGASEVEAVPTLATADRRVLRSETIGAVMRPGGQEIETIATHSPGQVELIPRTPTGRRRQVNGDRITVMYGEDNQVRSFQAVEASTRTDPPAKAATAAKLPPALTWSRSLVAHMGAKSGQIERIEQWDSFRYEEGERRAKAARATFEPEPDLITLENGARMWDQAGSTSADVIRLDQRNGRFTADGHVNSSRLPDQPKTPRPQPAAAGFSAMPGGGKEPLQAVAERMTSEKRNTLIRYDGHAVLWQGANRLESDAVTIDRTGRRLEARGNVVSRIVDDAAGGKGAAQFTTVRAQELVYTEADRRALYTGGVVAIRPDLDIRSARLEAFLAEPDETSRIERLFADGNAKVIQKAKDRTREGTGERAEYYALESRMVLTGGKPEFRDSKRGVTRGDTLVYFLEDDRLLVSGSTASPSSSRVPRK